MVILALWLAQFGYALLYRSYGQLRNPSVNLSIQDVMNPKLTGGPNHNGAVTPTSAHVSSSTTIPTADPPVGTFI